MRCCFCCCPEGNKTDVEVELTDASLIQYLRKVPLIKRLPEDDFPLVASVSKVCVFFAGEVIIRQDDIGNDFFMICEGEASVTVREEGETREVVRLGGGDYFGENALLYGEARTATITATRQLLTLKITRQDFEVLGLNKKLHFARRRAVHPGEDVHRAASNTDLQKTSEERAFIAGALRKYENLQALILNKDNRIDALVDVARKELVKAKQEIIVEGDLHANDFYVVQDGSFHIVVPENGGRASISAARMIKKHVGAGGCFGELALMYLTPRTATVVATTDAVVWTISRQHFKNILLQASNEVIEEHVKLLDSVQILDCLLHYEKQQLAGALVDMHFSREEIVLRQGESGNTFYILYDGEVSVQKASEEIKRLYASPSAAQYFGETALLRNDIRTATIQVTSETASALVLDRESFDLILGPLAELMEKVKMHRTSSSSTPSEGRVVRLLSGSDASPMNTSRSRKAIPWKDLTKIRVLGQGSFGVVELCLHNPSSKAYALKSLPKSKIKALCMEKSVFNERDVLFRIDSPFVIALHATYNKLGHLCFLMEYAPGGEVYDLYVKKDFFGDENTTRFYLGGVILGLEHMHRLRLVNRDVKPENVVLNGRGYPKLIDMGMAKHVVGKTYTTCGTPDYFAPEIITHVGHSFCVDWWALGVVLFELMAGPTPFAAPDPISIFKNVLKGIEVVYFPPKAKGVSERLIKALLKQRPSERLPMRMGSVQNLKNHQWFDGFDWTSLQNLRMTPPYVPNLAHPKRNDSSQSVFDSFQATDRTFYMSTEEDDDGTGWDAGFATED